MKKYISTLMEMYQDMEKENALLEKKSIKWKNDNPHSRYWENPYYTKPYSTTMLHYIITIINSLNNK